MSETSSSLFQTASGKQVLIENEESRIRVQHLFENDDSTDIIRSLPQFYSWDYRVMVLSWRFSRLIQFKEVDGQSITTLTPPTEE